MRRVACTRAAVRSARFAKATRCVVNTQVSNDEISRVVTKVMANANSQAVHLASVADTARDSTQVVHDALSRYPDGEGDREVKGKLQTLSASLKEYQSWLDKTQNAAQSIHREVDALFKHVGCTEATGPTVNEAERVEAASIGAFDEERVLDVGGNPQVELDLRNAKGLYNALVLYGVMIGRTQLQRSRRNYEE
jgi:uncharacterized protein YlxW (UPF0749 family)